MKRLFLILTVALMLARCSISAEQQIDRIRTDYTLYGYSVRTPAHKDYTDASNDLRAFCKAFNISGWGLLPTTPSWYYSGSGPIPCRDGQPLEEYQTPKDQALHEKLMDRADDAEIRVLLEVEKMSNEMKDTVRSKHL